MFRPVLCAILALGLLVHTINSQPLTTNKDDPSISRDAANDTDPSDKDSVQSAFGYNYPASFPRFDMDMNPFRAMERMMKAMEQRFGAMFGGNASSQALSGIQSSSSSMFGSSMGGDGGLFGNGGLFAQQPCQQTFGEEQLLIRCNVSGYERDDLKVDAQGNQLTIAGQRVEEGPDGHNSTVQFQQVLYLSDFNVQKMTSSTDGDGILTISVPRFAHVEEKKSTSSPVEVA